MKIFLWILTPLIVVEILIGMFIWKYSDVNIQENWRTQARLTLQSSKYTINRLINEENIPTQKAVDIVMRQIRNWWITWDSHAYYLTYKQSLDTVLFFDASSDCKSWAWIYKVKDIIPLFKDKKWAEKAFKQVLLWVDSIRWTDLSWNFDGAEEWLEYIAMPTNWATPTEWAYMLVLWTQSDEVYKNYELLKIMYYIYLTISTVLQLLCITIFYFLVEMKCKKQE
jgi:hypothetical protein